MRGNQTEDCIKTPFSTGHQHDAESRDSASGVRAACLSDVLLAGSSIQVSSPHPPCVNGCKVTRGPLALNKRVFFRTSKESVSDGVSLSSGDAQRLFNAVKELLQIPSEEQDPQTADGDGYRMALNSSNGAPACGIRYRCNTLLLQAQQLQLVCCFYQGIW